MPGPRSKTVLIPRRQFIEAGMGAAVLSGIGMPARAATDAPPFDPKDPASVLRTLFRMRASEDGRITMGWLKARRYGVVDAEITPLFGMVTGTFARHRVLADGSIENTSFELAFYTDLDTGEVLDTLTMPYTGQTVEVPRLLLGPSKSRIRPAFHELTEMTDREERTASAAAMRPVGSTRLERWLGPVAVHDDKIWITEASSASRVPADPEAPSVVYSESVTSQAAYADVMNPALASVPSTLSYTGVTSWRPWMQMGDHPGHTTSSGFGSKAFAVDELPDDYRAMAERFYPEALANPGAVLERIE